MTAQVVALQIAPASRLSMISVDRVETKSGRGITGDRYENSKKRQVSVQSLEELAAAEAELGRSLDAVETRRNVTLSEGLLDRTPGALLKVGAVQLQVVRDAAPCKLLEDSFGPGATRALRKRAGVVCKVVEGGDIAIGDKAAGLLS